MNHNQYFSDFYCTQCGHKTIPIIRKHGADREGGHLKNLYCPFCMCNNNCVEIRPFGQYQLTDFVSEDSYSYFAKDLHSPDECLKILKQCYGDENVIRIKN